MKKLLLVTKIDFWRHGAGARVRTRSLADYLGKATDLTIAHLGPAGANDEKLLRSCPGPWRFVWLNKSERLDDRSYAQRLRALCQAGGFHACIIDRLKLSFLRRALPDGVKTFLDTQDLVSAQEESIRAHGYTITQSVTWEQEMEVFRKFDGVLLIQQRDFNEVRAEIGDGKSILTPHPVSFSRQVLRPQVGTIGFIASRWTANVDGMGWFLKKVWPKVYRPGLTLGLYGFICEDFAGNRTQGLELKGFIPDLEEAYGDMDIVINPVLYGAGLKIKTVEALGNGLPLVTTAEGARGLENIVGRALLVADDADSFAAALNGLIDDGEKRRALGEAAYSYARENLSQAVCYRPLLEAINRAE